MAEQETEYIYQSPLGAVRFARDSAYWITAISGQSGLEVEMTATRGTGCCG